MQSSKNKYFLNSDKDYYTDFLAVLLLLCVSDSAFLFGRNIFFSYVLFFVFSVYIYLKKGCKKLTFLSFPIVYSILIIINISLINTDIRDNNGLGNIVSALASFLFFASFEFKRLKVVILKVISIVILFSIVVFIVSEFSEIPTISCVAFGIDYELGFGLFSLGWPYAFHRMAGIWHEPGACMIFIIIPFLLYIKELKQWQLSKSEKYCFFILAIGLICTLSTGGYICFSLIVVYLLISRSKKQKWSLFFIVIFAVAFIYFILSSEVVYTKLFVENDSKDTRTMDNLLCLSLALKEPFSGFGFGTSFMLNLINSKGTTFSNGILYTAACLGFIFIPIYIGFAGYSIRKMGYNISETLLVLGVVLLLQSNERFIEFPVSYIFVTNFFPHNRTKKCL